MRRLPNWMRGRLTPDEVIGEHEMLRWFVLPPNRWFNVYVHKHQADDPRFLHDHPADNVSIRLRGRLVEYRPSRVVVSLYPVRGPDSSETVYFNYDGPNGQQYDEAWVVPRFTRRRAERSHRLELLDGRPAWTIWIRFRNRRRWGFYEPGGWRPAITERQPAS